MIEASKIIKTAYSNRLKLRKEQKNIAYGQV